jgi:DNA-binding NarL/FixJ family response regulator
MTITVFLADDHTVVRQGLTFILNAEPDISVVGHAEDGRTAVDQAVAMAPDVAVMDIGMPRMTGVEATRRVREACPDTQVVILSMHSEEEHVSRALRAGARGYVLKECAGEELVEAVRTVHAGGSHLSPKVSDRVLESYVGEGDAEREPPLARLSDREREVFHLVLQGRTSAEIGEILSVSPKTVETYRHRMTQKLGVSGPIELVKFAVRHDLLSES